MAPSEATYCARCAEVGRKTALKADGKCPECDFEVNSASEAIGAMATLPIYIPMAILGEITGNKKIERAAESLARTGAEMGKDILPDAGKAIAAGAVFFVASKLWKAATR